VGVGVGAGLDPAVLRVAVLGSLRIEVDGRAVGVPGRRRRAVLAMLAMARGRVITADGLVDAIWPNDPPETGRRAVHSHVSRLRSNLGPAASRLRLVGAGYALHLEADALDSSVARRLAEQVRAFLTTDPTHALGLARTALALWRGQALAEFPDVSPLVADAVGLAELYRTLRDDEVEAALAIGQGGVSALAAEVAATRPPRERSTMLLMRALATEGRLAEAMAVAAAYRHDLVENTGLDPGPKLSDLEQRIAAGEPVGTPTIGSELAAATAARAEAAERPPVPQPVSVTGGVSGMSAPTRPAGPMVGRERDRMRLLELLDAHPAVTVTGPGGVGKTRLALDVAAELAERRQGGVAVITLATVTEPNRVPEAVASTLGLRISGVIGPHSVADALVGESLLLVLDNCEHVAAACRELITELLTRGLRVLATSRINLHVRDEFVLRLQPFPLPGKDTPLPDLVREPSVRAFIEHARRVRGEFTLTAADAAPLIEVIHRLDGLPLAIELAAAQLAALPIPALRARLSRALDALAIERPSVDARHRTLRATIDWSYGLLATADRHVLSAVAVFPGGIDLTSLEELTAELVPGIDPLVVVTRLVDTSLIVPDQETMTRYTLLDTVRQFLLDGLGVEQRQSTEGRFLKWAGAAALGIGSDLHSADEPAADRRLRAELANLRAARDLARAGGNLELRIDITLALDEASIWRGMHEVWGWSLELADDPAVRGNPRETEVLGSAAMSAWLLGDLDRAVDLANRGLRLGAAAGSHTTVREAGEDPGRRCWRALGAVSLFRSDFPTAREQWLRAAASPDQEQAATTAAAALAALYAGDGVGADQLLVRASSLLSDHPWPSVNAFVSYIRGEALARDNPDASAAAYTEALDTARHCGAGFVEGVAMVGRATLWTAVGDAPAAATSFRCLLDYWQMTDNRTMLWTTSRNAAQLLLDHGRDHTAVMVLAAADTAHSTETMDTPTAEGLQRMTRTLTDRLGDSVVDELERKALSLGADVVLDLARHELDQLAAAPTPPTRKVID